MPVASGFTDDKSNPLCSFSVAATLLGMGRKTGRDINYSGYQHTNGGSQIKVHNRHLNSET